MTNTTSMREKWFALVRGEDVGPIVSPLCDDWSLDMPYEWPYDDPDPFPPGAPHHGLSQQMAMAGHCGWDPTFLAAVPYVPANQDIEPTHERVKTEHGTRTHSRISTPYGELTSITERGVNTGRTIKSWLEDEADYRKALWVTQQQLDYDEDAAIEAGRVMRAGIGERGVLGTWVGAPLVNFGNSEDTFFHLADWPEAFEELHQATAALAFKHLATLQEAGFDYLFYCAQGTEWLSPDFFRRYIMPNTRKIFDRWRADGRFVLWHTCGLVKTFVELDFYNELKPDIFETLSVPPVGNLPSLRWARERLDPAIVTKGNIGLDVMLNGTPDEVRAAVRHVREETSGYRHIVGLSDDVLRGTPLANCLAFVEESRQDGQ